MQDLIQKMTHGMSSANGARPEDLIKWGQLSPTKLPNINQDYYCAAVVASVVVAGTVDEHELATNIINALDKKDSDIRSDIIDICWEARLDKTTSDLEVVARSLLDIITSKISGDVSVIIKDDGDIPAINELVKESIADVITPEYQQLVNDLWNNYVPKPKPKPMSEAPPSSTLVYYLLINNI